MSLGDFYRFLAELHQLQSESERSITEDLRTLTGKAREHTLARFLEHRTRLERDIEAKLDALEVSAHENGFVFCRVRRYLSDGRVKINASSLTRQYAQMSFQLSVIPENKAVFMDFLKPRYLFLLGTKLVLITETFVSDSESPDAGLPCERRFDQHIYS